MPATSPYTNLYHRLVANTHEPQNMQDCWCWSAKRDRGGYGRFNLYVPALRAKVILMSHIALWVWLHTEPDSANEFYLFYREFTASGLELDHLCRFTTCINPDHVEPKTASENCKRRVYASGSV